MDIFDQLSYICKKHLTRKEFLSACLKAGIGLSVSSFFFDHFTEKNVYALISEKRGLKEASFYNKINDETVKCVLCPEGCILKNGQRGFCRVREPLNGKLQTLVYGLICSHHIDPIEKKPLFHFLPASKTYSIATAGCNSRCKFCQNWTISQRTPEETRNIKLLPEEVVLQAKNNTCKSISYTYSEPVVFYEYVLATSEIASNKDIKNVIVTGGKINPDPLKDMCRYIDAANVDLKGFDKHYLREVCAQDLDNILANLIIMKKNGVWVELTNLIVPTLNDDMATIRKMSRWIVKELGSEVPLHFSRFWPQYKLRYLYPTPVETLEKARNVALEEGLRYVYIGNVPELSFQNTICPHCNKIIVKRKGYKVFANSIINGKCQFCGNGIAGIWD